MHEQDERAFKGIWIPKEIWLSKDLTIQEKLMLVEIDSLDNDDGCFASNKYFSNFFGISTARISQIINELAKKGYLKITYQKEGKQTLGRIIKIQSPPFPKVLNIFNRGIKFSKEGIKFSKGGYLENLKDNNIINNNINNNNNLNEFKLYNNFNQNLQCEYITKSSNERCMRKSSFNINGKNYCNQHARNLIPDLEIRTTKSKNYFDNKEVNNLFNEFLELRKKLKAVNSERAIKLLIDKLNSYDDEIKIKMINNSIENSWKSVYPLKKEKDKKIITENELKEIERKYANK